MMRAAPTDTSSLARPSLTGLDPVHQRMQEIQDYWQQYPGAAPGGTGLTGLTHDDAQGWSRLLNQQTEYENLKRGLAGQGPLTVKQGVSTVGEGPEPGYPSPAPAASGAAPSTSAMTLGPSAPAADDTVPDNYYSTLPTTTGPRQRMRPNSIAGFPASVQGLS